MAIKCEIVVDEGRDGQPPAAYDFDSLPRAGEFIRAMYEGDARRFRVERVEHQPTKTSPPGISTSIYVTDATVV